jgi:putative pyruvate formate lyase activating enzyme
MPESAYLESHRTGRLNEKIQRALQWMKDCSLCPRHCRVDRTAGQTGYCRTGRHAVVASYGPHFGEERPLVGRGGSGTIFFSHCNLFCTFCQNFDISHGGEGVPIGSEQLADIMLSLQEQGCHNINFVTPSHVICSILEALPPAIEKGLTIPLVYNTSGFDRSSALKLLDGVVDIYMPDFKFWDTDVSRRLADAPDYPERARNALREMHRQVGDLLLDERGVAVRGLLVRHLVMPESVAGTASILQFLAGEISKNTYINIMDQYHPCGGAVGKPQIGRRITTLEFEEALRLAKEAGLTRLDERHRHWLTVEL